MESTGVHRCCANLVFNSARIWCVTIDIYESTISINLNVHRGDMRISEPFVYDRLRPNASKQP